MNLTYALEEKAVNLTQTIAESISNAKKNFRMMTQRVKCVRAKIVEKLQRKKMTKTTKPYYRDQEVRDHP